MWELALTLNCCGTSESETCTSPGHPIVELALDMGIAGEQATKGVSVGEGPASCLLGSSRDKGETLLLLFYLVSVYGRWQRWP